MILMKLLKKILSDPAYLPYYWWKLCREFTLFNFDYRFLNGLSFPPKSVCLIPTEQCNLQCAMCDIGQRNARNLSPGLFPLTESISRGEGTITLDDWKRFIDDMVKRHWNPLILLTGTEPFIYPQILELIDYITANKLRLHITTNGTLLSRYAEKLVDLCVKPDALSVTISLDGIGEVHDGIRGIPGTFDRALEGLAAIDTRKKKCGKRWPEVNICYTISNFNHQHITQFAEWFYERDFDLKGITFSHLWFKDQTIVKGHNERYGKLLPVKQANLTGLDISAIDMESVYRQLQTVRKRYKNLPCSILEYPRLSRKESLTYYSRPTEVVFYERCLAPWRNVAINPRGEVIISPLCFDYSLGNIKRASFPVIWNDAPIRRFRKHLRKVGMYPACSRCCMLFDSKPKYYKLKDLI